MNVQSPAVAAAPTIRSGNILEGLDVPAEDARNGMWLCL